jgi:hypothetical protein
MCRYPIKSMPGEVVQTEEVDQRTDRRPVPALVSHWHLDVEVSADPEQFKRVIRGAGDRLGGALICPLTGRCSTRSVRLGFVWTSPAAGGYGPSVRHARRYTYIGPSELRDAVRTADGVAVDTATTLARWLAGRERSELLEPFTFVVAADGELRLAPRRSEHVALAGGHDVLAAGEIAFATASEGWQVVQVTNQSTGYCPDPDSWLVVEEALDRIGVGHPGDFTDKVIFRRCPVCGGRNIVRDDDFTCAQCDSILSAQWNFTPN